MPTNRSPGRYKLHRLGWAAFEDLCLQIMRTVLGETCTRFRPGPDGGRDGWYRGIPAGLLASHHAMVGQFVVQCKHTSSEVGALTLESLSSDLGRARELAADSPINYLLLTNRQVSGGAERRIREKFESIPGVVSCMILGETWIEDTLDSNPRLLRLVPRLYGIGDLSQILSFTIEQQTKALLEDLAQGLRTYVPTGSYRQAEAALHEHRFVVLVGPPASGKSTIAANLCVVCAAQDPDVRVLRVESADGFKGTWSPADPKTVYWVDDVFGETTLDADRLKEWSVALDKVEAARRRGARIVFCTRDYILADAGSRLKRAKLDMVHDARVRVDVANLTLDERAAILYNHIKMGDLPTQLKTRLKPHLDAVAKMPALTPEIARRLGSNRFHAGIDYSLKGIARFVVNPVGHFSELVHGLSNEETAALALCVLYGNALPAPIPSDPISHLVFKSYDVSHADASSALERLEGSLVKQVRAETSVTWQLHHPSMFEALQDQFARTLSHLELYVSGAKANALLRNTTTILGRGSERLVFIPDTLYASLITRLESLARSGARDRISTYLVDRASDRLLWQIQSTAPELLDRALTNTSGSEDTDPGARLAVRLYELSSDQLLDARRREMLELALLQEARATGWSGWLDIPGLEATLPLLRSHLLEQEIDNGWSSLKALVEHGEDYATTSEEVRTIRDGLDSHVDRLRQLLLNETFSASEQVRLDSEFTALAEYLEDRIERLEQEEAEREIYEEDLYRDRMSAEPNGIESDRFSDVDE